MIGFGAWEAGMAPEWGEAPSEEQVIEGTAVRHVDSLQEEFSMLVLEDRELVALGPSFA